MPGFRSFVVQGGHGNKGQLIVISEDHLVSGPPSDYMPMSSKLSATKARMCITHEAYSRAVGVLGSSIVRLAVFAAGCSRPNKIGVVDISLEMEI